MNYRFPKKEKFLDVTLINGSNDPTVTNESIESVKITNNDPISKGSSEIIKTESPPILNSNLPEVKKVTVPWDPQLSKDQEKVSNIIINNNKNNGSEIQDSEQRCASTSLFGNLPDPKKGPLPNSKIDQLDENSQFVSVRKFFNEEYCYIMDAKNCGNIGRYLNHSCNPNVFVQNVFVDTQDLRFPWVAFFAMVYIRAGSELTWDYNYDVGSVPGKVMYCYCASSECRGRLL